MSQRYNFSHFEAEYKVYLAALNTKPVSVKNYVSDLRYFFSWIKSLFQIDTISYSDINSIFSKRTIAQYLEHLQTHSGSDLTHKRRISTVRSFLTFCVKQRWLQENPANILNSDQEFAEIQSLVQKYCAHLEQAGHKHDLERQKNIITSFILS